MPAETFDALARALARGELSRRRALGALAGLLAAGALAGLRPRPRAALAGAAEDCPRGCPEGERCCGPNLCCSEHEPCTRRACCLPGQHVCDDDCCDKECCGG